MPFFLVTGLLSSFLSCWGSQQLLLSLSGTFSSSFLSFFLTWVTPPYYQVTNRSRSSGCVSLQNMAVTSDGIRIHFEPNSSDHGSGDPDLGCPKCQVPPEKGLHELFIVTKQGKLINHSISQTHWLWLSRVISAKGLMLPNGQCNSSSQSAASQLFLMITF